MRGGSALRLAPLIVGFVFLSTCRLQFQLIEPSVELNAQTAFQSGKNIVVDYKFMADESALRCRYTVGDEASILMQGVTGEFPPGTWQQLQIALDPEPAEGEYTLKLVAQATRGNGFVDLSFLTTLFDFYLDFNPPAEPNFSPAGGLFSAHAQVILSHEEWDGSNGAPVSIYYTTDHTDPTSNSSLYIAGSQILVELSETPTEIRAIAIDDSRRTSSIKSVTYSFINIDHMHSTSETGPLNVFYVGETPQFIYLHGFGLNTVGSAEFTDADNTPATTAAVIEKNESGTQVILAVSIPQDGSFGGNGTTSDGTLKVIASGGVSDEIIIDLLPGPPPP